MPVKTPFCCPQFSSWMMFTSESWWLKHIKLHGPKRLHVACRRHLTIGSTAQWVQPTLCREFNANKDSVDDMDAFPSFEHIQSIIDSKSQTVPPPLPRRNTYPGGGAPRSDSSPEPSERDPQSCLETNIENNLFYLFATHEEYKYIQCGMNKKGEKRYYDNVLKQENIVRCFQATKMGIVSRSSWRACQMIRLLGSGNYTLSRKWDGITITNALSNTGVQTSSKAWDGWCSSLPTPSSSFTPLSVALTVIRHRNTSRPRCTLQAGGGRHR